MTATRCIAACNELGYGWAGLQNRERRLILFSADKVTDTSRVPMLQVGPEEEHRPCRSHQLLRYPL